MINKNQVITYLAGIPLHFYPYKDRHGTQSGLVLYFIYSYFISYFNSYYRRFHMPLSHCSSGKNKYQHKRFIVITINEIRNQGIIRVSSLQSHALSTKKKKNFPQGWVLQTHIGTPSIACTSHCMSSHCMSSHCLVIESLSHIIGATLSLNVGGGSLVSPRMAPQGSQALKNRERQEACPQEKCKGDASFISLAPVISVTCWRANETRKGNCACEPENRRDNQEDKGGKSMVEASKVNRRNGQIDDNEQAPD